MKRWSMGLLAALALAVGGGGMLLAGAQAAPAAHTARQARLNVGVQVLRFAAAGRKVSAVGQVSATLTDNHGMTKTIHTTVALAASTGGGCKVLHLYLKELTLQLLGLNAHLDPVTLDITGDAKGGVLGSLFCKLAHARASLARVEHAARAQPARAFRAGSCGALLGEPHARRPRRPPPASARCSTSSSARSTSSCSASWSICSGCT